MIGGLNEMNFPCLSLVAYIVTEFILHIISREKFLLSREIWEELGLEFYG